MLVLAGLLLAGCISTNVGKARYPEPPKGFVAQASYGVPLDAAWKSVLATLDQERIPVVSADRALGRITTESIDGEAKMLISFMGATSHFTRYRFTITVNRQGGRTAIRPLATLESSQNGEGQWLNITRDYPKEAQGVEQWLLAKIEAKLSAR